MKILGLTLALAAGLVFGGASAARADGGYDYGGSHSRHHDNLAHREYHRQMDHDRYHDRLDYRDYHRHPTYHNYGGPGYSRGHSYSRGPGYYGYRYSQPGISVGGRGLYFHFGY